MADRLLSALSSLSPVQSGDQIYIARGTTPGRTTIADISQAYTPELFGAISGSVSSAQRSANLTAIQLALSAAMTDGVPVFIPGRTYEIAGTIDAQSSYNGLRMFGMGTSVSRIIQYTDNVPILKVGNSIALSGIHAQVFSGFSLEYATIQTGNSSALGISFSKSRMAHFSDMLVINAYTGIGLDSTACFMYSCQFDNIRIYNWVDYAINIDSVGGLTGCVWNNIYCNCGENDFATSLNVTGGVKLDIVGNAGVWNQLNLEWFNPSEAALNIYNTKTYVFNSLRTEGITSRGSKGLVYSKNSNGTFNGYGMNNLRFRTTDGCTVASIFVMGDGDIGASYGGNQIYCNNLSVSSMTITGLSGYVLQSEDLINGNKDCQFYLSSFILNGSPSISAFANTAVHASSSIRHDPLITSGELMTSGGAIFNLLNADYTLRADKDGQRFLLTTALTADRTITLSNTILGTFPPPRGATIMVSRGPAGTGAFNLNINNFDATLLVALAAAGNWAELMCDGTNWVVFRNG